MVCTSPDQWFVPTSLTTRNSSPHSQQRSLSGDRWDETSDANADEDMETDLDSTLDHEGRLTTDVVVNDDCHCIASSELGKIAAVEAPTTTDHDPHHPGTDSEGIIDGSAAARERLVEDKLARVLVALASEQHNVCLAANAGNALLVELDAARKELDGVQDAFETVQLERDEAVRETQRLHDRTVALEKVLQCYNVPYESWNPTGPQNALSNEQQIQKWTSSITSCRSSSTTSSCEQCATREVDMLQLEQRIDVVNRRCLQSELACEREQHRRRELEEEITQLQQQNNEESLEILSAQKEREFLSAQLEQQTQELEGVQAGRDMLRRTVRRLEAENIELQAHVTARDECIQKLERCKARATTQLQVAENRTASAQAETERATKTLEQFQQLMQGLEQQRERDSSTGRGSNDVDVELCEHENEITAQLLQDATREVAVLRQENRVLRQQRLSGGSPNHSQVRDRRRKMLRLDNGDSSLTTAANVLALDNHDRKNGCSAKIESDSDKEPNVSLVSLSNDNRCKFDVSVIAHADTLPQVGNIRRKMPLTMDWVDKTPSICDDTAVKNNESLLPSPTYKEEPTVLAVESEDEHRDFVNREKRLEVERNGELEILTRAPSVVKRHYKLSSLGHVTDYCSNFDAYKSDIEKDSCVPMAGENVYARVRRLSVEELRTAGIESPPSSPLYFGLSFIACATAATAASLLVRR